jgi:hypothetical protein
MAAEDIKKRWEGSLVSISDVDNLNSLADGNIWLSASFSDGSPNHEFVQLSYTIEFNATPVAGDYLELFMPIANGDGTLLWPGGVGDAEQALTTAAAKAEFLAACRPFRRHEWQTSHGAVFKSVATLILPAPNFRFAVRAFGEALKSTGNSLKYRLGTYQRQAS